MMEDYVSFDQDLVIFQNWILSVQNQDFGLISQNENVKHFADKDIRFKKKALLFLIANSESQYVQHIKNLKHLNVLDNSLNKEQLVDLIIAVEMFDAFYEVLKIIHFKIFLELISLEANMKFVKSLNAFQYLVSISERIENSKDLTRFSDVDFVTGKIKSFLDRNSCLLTSSMERFADTLHALQQIYKICFSSTISDLTNKYLLQKFCKKILRTIELIIESKEFSEMKKNEIIPKFGLNITQIIGLIFGSLDELITHESHNLIKHVLSESDVCEHFKCLKVEELLHKIKSISNHYKSLFVGLLLKNSEFYENVSFEINLKELLPFLSVENVSDIIDIFPRLEQTNETNSKNIEAILMTRIQSFPFLNLVEILKKILKIRKLNSNLFKGDCSKETITNAIRQNDLNELVFCFIQDHQKSAKYFFGFVLTQKNNSDQYSSIFSSIYNYIYEFDDFDRIFLETFFQFPINLISRSFDSFTNMFSQFNSKFNNLIINYLEQKFLSKTANIEYDFQIFVLFVDMLLKSIKSGNQSYHFEDFALNVCNILQFAYCSPENFDEEKIKITDSIISELSKSNVYRLDHINAIEEILKSTVCSSLIRYRIRKLFVNDQTPLLQFMAPKFSDTEKHHHFISILLYILPRCVADEWKDIFAYLNGKFESKLRAISFFINTLYLFSVSFDFSNVCHQNCYRYCLVKFQNLLDENNIENMDEDQVMLDSIERLIAAMPETFRKTEGLVMLQKFMPKNEFPIDMICKLKLTD